MTNNASLPAFVLGILDIDLFFLPYLVSRKSKQPVKPVAAAEMLAGEYLLMMVNLSGNGRTNFRICS